MRQTKKFRFPLLQKYDHYTIKCHAIMMTTVQKMKFSINDFFKSADLVTFTEEILNGRLHFL